MDRRTLLKQLLATPFLFTLSKVAVADSLSELRKLSVPNGFVIEQGKKAEVLEFFHYACPHCRHFDPLLRDWHKKHDKEIDFHQMPVIWGPDFEALARLFYTLKASNTLEQLHSKAFVAVQDEHVDLTTEKGVAQWISQQGTDSKNFMATYHSFGVDNSVRRAIQIGKDYKIDSVPALVINRQYVLTPNSNGFEGMLQQANELLTKS